MVRVQHFNPWHHSLQLLRLLVLHGEVLILALELLVDQLLISVHHLLLLHRVRLPEQPHYVRLELGVLVHLLRDKLHLLLLGHA